MASSGGTTQRVLSAVIRVNDRFTSPMQRIIRITQRFQSAANRIRPIVARVRDLASPVITRIQSGLRRLADTRVGRFVISAVDKVTQVLNPVVSRVRNFVSGHYQAVLSAIDKATKVISSVLGKAKAFAGKMYSATVSVKDKASSILGSLKGKLAALAGGVTIGVALKTGIEGLGEEQTQKITINRVFENAGGTKKQAQKQTQEYYKYLEEYANKTPFSTSEMTQFGTKSAMMAKGDMGMAKQLTDAQANVKAFVGDLRTSQEVSDAFFSASTGNLESLNNMLGTGYKTFDEALKGIQKDQGGLVNQMSTTIPGLISTVKGKIAVGLKEMVKPFEPLLQGALSGVISQIDTFAPKLSNFASQVAQSFQSFSKSQTAAGLMRVFGSVCTGVWNGIKTAVGVVKPIIKGVFDFIGSHAPQVQNIMSIFGSAWKAAWSMIKAAIDAVSPIIKQIFIFIGDHANTIKAAIKALQTVWNIAWKVIGKALQVAWAIIKPPLGLLLDLIEKICNWVSDLQNKWEALKNTLSKPINAVVNMTENMFGGGGSSDSSGRTGQYAFGSGVVRRDNSIYSLHHGEKILNARETRDYMKTKKYFKNRSNLDDIYNYLYALKNRNNESTPRNAFGSSIIRKNGEIHELHQGEKVLTARETRDYQNQNNKTNLTININGMTVREEADITKIANELVNKLNQQKIIYGG